jgi:hypothetical protein
MRKYIFMLLLLVVTSLSAVSGKAQEETKNDERQAVSIPYEAAKDFSRAINFLSKSTKSTIVTEDAPLEFTLDNKSVEMFAGRSLHLNDLVTSIASAYDYSVEVLHQNRGANNQQRPIYIFKKRYSNPRDIPCVTPAECLNIVQDVRQMLRSQEPNPPVLTVTELAHTIWRVLSQEQRQTLSSGGKIPVNSLEQNQRTKLIRMTKYIFYDAFSSDLENPFAILSQFDTLRLKEHDKIYPHQKKLTDGLLLTLEYIIQNEKFYSGINRNGGDKSDKGRAGYTPDIPIEKIHKGTLLIGDVVDDINKDDINKKEVCVPVIRYEVAKALYKKRVTLAGAEFASSHELFEALAQVYGLRTVQRTADSPRRLEEIGVASATRPEDVIPLMRRRLPESLRRVLHEGREQELQAKEREIYQRRQQYIIANNLRSDKPWDDKTSQAMDSFAKELRACDAERSRLREHWDFMRIEIGRRIVKSVEVYQKQQKANGNNTKDLDLAVRDLDSLTQEYIALLQIMPLLEEYKTQVDQRDVPLYISQFDQLYLYGGPETSQGKNTLTIRLGRIHPVTGQIQRLVGISQVAMPKE